MKKIIIPLIIVTVAVVAIVMYNSNRSSSKNSDSQVAGTANQTSVIKIDGSSTVFPITEGVAEEYQKENAGIKVTVGLSGTGGGFKKFCNGEIDISDASRPIKSSEAEACQKAGIEYIELPIAYDGLAILVNPENTWAKEITVAELKKLWEPEAQNKITKWNQIRTDWPNEEIHLFGPGVDSGTFDYFTGEIVGEEGKSRGDYTASEDDNVLVQGVATDKNALGYFGVAYYTQNQDKMKLVAVNDEDETNGTGAVLPNYDEVVKGTYQPLSRPIFIYVSIKALTKPEIKSFVDFYLANAGTMSKEVGYIALPDDVYSLVTERFKNNKKGSVYAADTEKGVTIKELLEKEQ